MCVLCMALIIFQLKKNIYIYITCIWYVTNLNAMLCCTLGMVDDPSESLFTFFNNSFENFHDPSFIPIFTSNFSNPKLGMEADELCNGDTACLFDIAATGSLEIGMLTLKTSRELDEMMKNSGSGTLHV